jgi:hypothetical protein
VGGNFDTAGGLTANNIAWWDGSSWHVFDYVTAADNGLNRTVYALAMSDFGLVAGGAFTDPATIATADYCAYWGGTFWKPIDSGYVMNASVYDIVADGNEVYIAGKFTDAGGVTEADYVARWTRTGNSSGYWTAFPGAADYYNTLLVNDDELYAGTENSGYVCRWQPGGGWENINLNSGFTTQIRTLAWVE